MMTPEQEKTYLLDLLFEAARYRDVPMDSPYSAIELEIRDRIQRLNRSDDDTDARWKTTIQQIEKPEIQIGPEPVQDRPAPKPTTPKPASYKERKREAAARYRELNVRVHIDGKPTWKPRSDCLQVPTGNGRFRWEWRPAQAQAVDKLGDALWAEHEQNN